ncbi:MAG: lamin tail domain-containing protein [Verrucomicrobiota bacterium]
MKLSSCFPAGCFGFVFLCLGLATSTHGQATNGIFREVYTNVAGTDVPNLTSAATYPNSPDITNTITWGLEHVTNFGGAFGVRLRGWIRAPIGGSYVFYLSANDSGDFLLSTDENPTNKIIIASVSNAWSHCSSRNWVVTGTPLQVNQKSSGRTLTAGKLYYFEALMKNGGGTDNLGVTWQRPGDAVPANGAPPIPNTNLTFQYAPIITAHPTNQTAWASSNASFEISVGNIFAPAYQWQRNSNNIANATNATLTLTNLPMTNDQTYYRCVVSNSFGTNVTLNARLNVLGIPAAPTNLVATATNAQVLLTWSTTTGATNYNVKRALTTGGPYSLIKTLASASFTDTNLTNDVTYYYVVSGLGSGGEGSNSLQAVATPHGPPPAPLGLTGISTNGGALLIWNTATNAITYNVKRATVTDGPFTVITNVTTTNFTDVSTVYGTTYYYVVSGLGIGGEGTNSLEVMVVIGSPPPAPLGLTATSTNAQVSLVWNSSLNATNYYLKRSITNGGPYLTVATLAATNYTDTDVTNFVTYYYVVSGVGLAGEGAISSQASAMPQAPPIAPSGLTATNKDYVINLSWNTVSNATSFNLKRSLVNGGPYTTVSNLTTTSYADTNVVNSNTYYYVVSGLGIGGEGTNSSQVSVNLAIDGPVVLSARGGNQIYRARLVFNKALLASTATNLANYAIDNGLQILGATLEFSTNVNLATSPQAEGTNYTITVNNVRDSTAQTNLMVPNSTIAFQAWRYTNGFLLSEIYTNITGSTVANLTNNTRYPNLPDRVYYTNWAESVSNYADYYGVRLSGYFVPTNSGTFVFYLANDDEAAFNFATNSYPSNAVRRFTSLGTSTVFRDAYCWTNDLVASNRYYFEALLKENTGNDYLRVGVRLPGVTTNTTVLPSITNLLYGTYAMPYSFVIASPYSLSGNELGSVTFSVSATTMPSAGQPFLRYQWQKNGTNIANATNLTFTVTNLTVFDTNNAWRCVVSSMFSSSNSANAYVTNIAPDLTPPTVVGWTTYGTNGLLLTYSEPVSDATATNLANYLGTNGFLITGAIIKSGTNVFLTTSPQQEGSNYSFTINGVKDKAYASNSIMANTVLTFDTGSYVAGYLKREYYTNITGGSVANLTGSTKYPYSPDFINYTNIAETMFTNQSGTRSFADSYGMRLSGYFVPTNSGTHIVYLMNDDDAQLFFSTNESPAGLQSRLSATGAQAYYSDVRSWTNTFTAGNRYYFETLFKENNGSDYLLMAVRVPGDTTPTLSLPSMSPALFGTYVPRLRINLASQPVNTNGTEHSPVTFNVAASVTTNYGSIFLTYQWQENGTNIPGATNAMFTTPPLELSDLNLPWVCQLTALNTISNTVPALITNIAPDTTPPYVVYGFGAGTNHITVIYSEPVNAQTATNLSNYVANNGVTVVGAQLDVDGRTVFLTTTPMLWGSTNTLWISGVQDLALLAPNTIASNTAVTFLVSDYAPFVIGSAANARYSMNSNGWDLAITSAGFLGTGTNDQFLFGAQRWQGNFDFKTRIDTLNPANPWSRAGLMARTALADASAFVAVWAYPSLNGCNLQWRSTPTAAPTQAGSMPVNSPYLWLRLQRSNDLFQGYGSYDGQNWTRIAATTVALGNPIYVGMAISSCNATNGMTAKFRDLTDATGTGLGSSTKLPMEPLGASSRRTGLTFSEIMYSPIAQPGTNNGLQFIEIFNSASLPEDLTGYRLSGSVDYNFPAGTFIPGGGFLVVARYPIAVQNYYGITGVLGPYTNSLPSGGGTIRLRNAADAILLEVNYDNKTPWPLAADGVGHSLVLARPSYGENDPRAWMASDCIDGTPGRYDGYSLDPQKSVVINEIMARPDSTNLDYIELYNRSAQPVDISGCVLSANASALLLPDSTNAYRLPAATIIPGGGFLWYDRNQLGFGLSQDGEIVYFANSNHTRILDAMAFGGQLLGISTGRTPDGADSFRILTTPTPGTNNSGPLLQSIVINEIMYKPISGNSDDQYVELYNRGSTAVNLSGWQLTDGISFTFPANSIIQPDGYLVVAKNLTNLLAHYPGTLNTFNTVGDFSGSLAGSGEHVSLLMPDLAIKTNTFGQLTTNVIWVAENELTYGRGGNWGTWANGGGSSLELVDPHSDNQFAANWADSDETAKSQWTFIDYTATMGEPNSAWTNDNLHVYLLDPGECLVDEIEVYNANDPANNLLGSYGTFEDVVLTNVTLALSGNTSFINAVTNYWMNQGGYDQSTIEVGSGYDGGNCLHIRGACRGDTGPNKIKSPNFSPKAYSTNAITIRAKARWLHGWPEILLRVHGGTLEAGARLDVPLDLGSPGAPNSRALPNTGPAIYQVVHAPVLPAANQNVLVTARVSDPDGISALNLMYRIDPATNFISVPMTDNGLNGDAVAGDGIYTGMLPGQATNAVAAFYLQAVDGLGAASVFPKDVFPTPPLDRCFPNDSYSRECVVRWGELQMRGTFPTYHLWATLSSSNRWASREPRSNCGVDGTFVYNDYRVVYNATPRYSGSAFHRPNQTTGPGGSSRCDYDIGLPDYDMVMGASGISVDLPGNGSGSSGSDPVGLTEQIPHILFRKLGISYNQRRYVHLFMNGTQRSAISAVAGNFVLEDTQRPDGDLIGEWYSGDTGGELFKLDDWFEFNDVATSFSNNDADLTRRYITVNGVSNVLDTARYRYQWQKRGYGPSDSVISYTNFYRLLCAASPTSVDAAPINYPLFNSVANLDQWAREFSVQRVVGNFDSYGFERGKNNSLYLPAFNRVEVIPYDVDWSLGFGSRTTNQSLFNTADARITALYNVPEFRRAYLRALQELIDLYFNNAYLDPEMDARIAVFQANNVSYDPNGITTNKVYVAGRNAYIRSQLVGLTNTFNVATPLYLETNNNLITITGAAPVNVRGIYINGTDYPVTWATNYTNWSLNVVLNRGTNLVKIQGYDQWGNPLTNALVSLVLNVTNNIDPEAGFLVINEIMFNPSVSNASYVELFNRSTNTSFDLSNHRLKGVGYDFPAGTLLGPRSFLVLAMDTNAFQQAYGTNITPFAQFPGTLQSDGETLTLVKLGVTTNLDVIIDKVKYDTIAPWPSMAATPGSGQALQLIDAAQDTARVSNWSDDAAIASFTPGATNSVAGTIAPYPLVWLNEVQPNNPDGFKDNTGTPQPWIELYNNDTNTLSLNGYYLANSYTNLNEWAFPTGTVIAPGEFKIIFADGHPELNTGTVLHTSFRLNPTNGSIALVQDQRILDYLNYSNMLPRYSFGSCPDGQLFDRKTFYYVTPGTNNNGSFLPLTVRINEWMAGNTRTLLNPLNNKWDDWFELYNYGTNTADLSGYYLTRYTTNNFLFKIPNGYTIPPGGYYLVWADKLDAQNSTNLPNLHANFKLTKSGAYIGLFAPDGSPVDTVTFGAQTSDISQGRYPDGSTNVFSMTNATPGTANVFANLNTKPTLAAIPSFTNSAGALITCTFSAVDTDRPPQTLTFSLDTNAPTGATVDSVTGGFSWTPQPLQAGITYTITGRVTDNGVPPMSDAKTFQVKVLPPNSPPVISPIDAQYINENALWTFAVPATDPDLPAQVLTYGLLAVPTGVTINTNSGILSWTPTETQGPSTNSITVMVTDNGVPALSATQAFTVVVHEVNQAPTLALITNIVMDELTTLWVTNHATDADWPANNLTFRLLSGPTNTSLNPVTGVFSWLPTEAQGPSTNLVSIAVTDDGLPPLSATQSFQIIVREVNSTPYFTNNPGVLFVKELSTLTFTNYATDDDIPTNRLTFEPLSVPSGMTLNTNTGVVIWTPPLGAANSSNTVVIRVYDDGQPSLSATQSVLVFVTAASDPPQLSVPASQTIDEMVLWQGTNYASDPDMPVQTLIFSLVSAPPGFQLNTNNGVMAWTPTEMQGPGTNHITIAVTDNGTPPLSVTQSFTLYVHEVNRAPTLTPIADQVMDELTTLVITNLASDPDWPANKLIFTLVSAPTNAVVNSTNGIFTWTPTEAQGPSTNLISICVTDDGTPPLSATQSFVIVVNEVNSAPYFTNAWTNLTVRELATLTITNRASDNDLPTNTLTYELLSAPSGVTLDANSAVLTWTPALGSATTTNTIVMRVTDNGQPPQSATQSITMVVVPANYPPVLTVQPVWYTDELKPFEMILSATDPDPNDILTFQLASAPEGMTLFAGAWLQWTPTEAQGPSSNFIQVAISDNGYPPITVTQSFVVIVREVNQPPKFSNLNNRTAFEGIPFNWLITATDPDLPAQTLTFSLEPGAPTGAIIQSNTGLFSWTPTKSQGGSNYVIGVRVTDDGTPPLSDAQSFNLMVMKTNSTPVLTVPTNYFVTPEEQLLTFTNFATDSDLPAQILTFSLDAAPTNASINPSNGVFTWTPTEAQGPGTNVFGIVVTDSGVQPLSATQTVTVVVLEVNRAPIFTNNLANVVIQELSTLVFTNQAMDPDLPPNQRFYALLSAPVGVMLDTNSGVLTWTPSLGTATSTNPIIVMVYDDGIPSLSATQTIDVVVIPANHAPQPGVIPDQTIIEELPFNLTITATDADVPAQNLVFSLAPVAPTGAVIQSDTGLFTWTPTEIQGGTNYTITVRVTDNGLPPLSDFRSFNIMVLKTNSVPILVVPTNYFVIIEEQVLRFTNLVTDTDLPAQSFIFSLLSAPTNATINTSNGVFAWTPSEAQGPGNYLVGVRVTDNGIPPLSATQWVTIDVLESNLPPVLTHLANQVGEEGVSLMVQVTATDPDIPTNILTFSLLSAPTNATINASNGVFSWSPLPGQDLTNVITVRVTDNGVPPLSDTQTFSVFLKLPPLSFSSTATNGNLNLNCRTFQGFTYQAQFLDDLSGNWTVLDNFVATGGVYHLPINITTNGHGFFRLLRLP